MVVPSKGSPYIPPTRGSLASLADPSFGNFDDFPIKSASFGLPLRLAENSLGKPRTSYIIVSYNLEIVGICELDQLETKFLVLCSCQHLCRI